MSSTMFVRQLDECIQKAISKELKSELIKLNMSENEFIESYNNGMNSRLCDLKEIINIEKFI